MNSYYCIVNTPGVPVREIAVLSAGDDETARAEAASLTRSWPGYETIAVYDGERPVGVLANPSMGFAPEPVFRAIQAA